MLLQLARDKNPRFDMAGEFSAQASKVVRNVAKVRTRAGVGGGGGEVGAPVPASGKDGLEAGDRHPE